ncbi:MAG: InlB B-repeat-containing protein [Planctomycetota bacterium]|jgi:hypothetical protein
MKHSNAMSVSRRIISLAVIVLLTGMFGSAYAGTGVPSLLLQQSPPDGGTTTPDVGLHEFGLHTDITLTAVARPGYQFVCWLGDVSDPTASRTVVYLDGPKIIIAVYERDEFELLTPSATAVSGSVGGTFISAGDYARTGYTGGGRRRPSRVYPFTPDEPPEPEPEPEPELPVPTPEPATIMLLGFGALILVNRKRSVP